MTGEPPSATIVDIDEMVAHSDLVCWRGRWQKQPAIKETPLSDHRFVAIFELLYAPDGFKPTHPLSGLIMLEVQRSDHILASAIS